MDIAGWAQVGIFGTGVVLFFLNKKNNEDIKIFNLRNDIEYTDRYIISLYSHIFEIECEGNEDCCKKIFEQYEKNKIFIDDYGLKRTMWDNTKGLLKHKYRKYTFTDLWHVLQKYGYNIYLKSVNGHKTHNEIYNYIIKSLLKGKRSIVSIIDINQVDSLYILAENLQKIERILSKKMAYQFEENEKNLIIRIKKDITEYSKEKKYNILKILLNIDAGLPKPLKRPESVVPIVKLLSKLGQLSICCDTSQRALMVAIGLMDPEIFENSYLLQALKDELIINLSGDEPQYYLTDMGLKILDKFES